MMEDDPFGDMFEDDAPKIAPQAKKFQPKAKIGPKKGPIRVPKPSAIPVKAKQIAPKPSGPVSNEDTDPKVLVTPSSNFSEAEKPKELPDGSEFPSFKEPNSEYETKEPVVQQQHEDVAIKIDSLGVDEENPHDMLLTSNELEGGESGKFHPEPVRINGFGDSESSAPVLSVVNEVLHIDGDCYSSFGKPAPEVPNEGILSHLESMDHLLGDSVDMEGQTPNDSHEVNEPSTSHSNNIHRENIIFSPQDPITVSSIDINSDKGSIFPVQNGDVSSDLLDIEVFPGVEDGEGFPRSTTSIRAKFVPKPKAKTGVKTSNFATSQETFVNGDHQQEPMIDLGSEYKDDGTVPGSVDEEIFQYSSIDFEEGLEDPNLGATTPQPLNDETLNDQMENHCFDASILEDEVQRQDSSLNNVVDEEGEMSPQLRNHMAAAPFVEECNGEAQEDENHYTHPYSGNGEDEQGTYRDETASEKKTATRKARERKSKNGEPSRKRKEAGEASEQSTKEPKKKFPHTTRRKRRCVDKELLAEDDINPKTLKMRDLIRLAEHKERLTKKIPKVPKKPTIGESVENLQDGSNAYNRGGGLPSEQGGTSSTQPSLGSIEVDEILFNYQSFMEKTKKTKWSKQDTELFYEAIRQFGADFSMIKELFPGLSRHQVKLKYKKEERQNPLRLNDVLSSRSKDHKHFEYVIERLQTATAEEESMPQDSEGITVEDGSDHSNPETDGVDKATKPENDEEGENKATGGNNDEPQSSLKTDENREEMEVEVDDDENDEDFFSSYKSEL